MGTSLIKDITEVEASLAEGEVLSTAGTCLSAYLLALFASTRSSVVQTWRFYEYGLGIIRTCAYDDGVFFERFGVTPTQIAYVFYLLGCAYDLPRDVMLLQIAEGAQTESSIGPAWDAPLVIDVGMGLGADTRYYLSQGFRVVAVEANPGSISAALSVEWIKPFLQTGQFSFLNAAVAPPGTGGTTTTLFTVVHRPEQSDGRAWVGQAGGKPVSVRTIECSDLLRVYGQAVYMKVDIESSTSDCLESLHRAYVPGSLESQRLLLPA